MKIVFDVTESYLLRKLQEFRDEQAKQGHPLTSMKVEVDSDSLPRGIYNPQGEAAFREVGTTVRAKMACTELATYSGGGVKVKLGAVYSNDPNSENRAFSDATPSGSCEMMIQGGRPAIKLFEAGAEYFLDFVKVQK